MKKRLNLVRDRVASHNADAALLTFLPNIQWACGFSGSNGLLLVRSNGAVFVSDGRYETQARREVEGAEVHIPGYNLYEYVEEANLLEDADTVLYQSDHVTVDRLEKLRDRFADVKWEGVSEFLTSPIASKDGEEIERIQSAQRTTDAVFEHLLDVIEPGLTEREVAAEIIYQHLRRGADKMSFDPIVASGPNAALPHARSSDRTIQEGDVLLIDMGCFKDGYASDMSRTLAIGEPSDQAFCEVYETVLKAQQSAIEAARSAMTGKELDAVARDVIEEEGYGDHFSHGLGHGLGLEIHEWPKLSYHVAHDLPEGAAVTIEPGIYLQDRFGVRIEDIVVLRENGCENLTNSPKELITIE